MQHSLHAVCCQTKEFKELAGWKMPRLYQFHVDDGNIKLDFSSASSKTWLASWWFASDNPTFYQGKYHVLQQELADCIRICSLYLSSKDGHVIRLTSVGK